MNNLTLNLAGRMAVGLGVCTAVGVACKVTKSGWPLLGLVFLPSMGSAVTEVTSTTIQDEEDNDEE